MLTLCTYVLTNDTGLAPNPFWGWCTLAVCTPNRQGARLDEDDWIAGFTTKAKGHRLIYAMQVSERIDMNAYFNDERFAKKKPNLGGTWQERCGDNFYSQNLDGSWKQHRNRFHIGDEYRKKDTRKPIVFVTEHFWYFGREAKSVPDQYLSLIGLRGIRVKHSSELVINFIDWVKTAGQPGIIALPADNPDASRFLE